MMCDVTCMNEQHAAELNQFKIIEALKHASLPLYRGRRTHRNSIPGWNEHVAELHQKARDAFLTLLDHGKPRQGPVFELNKKASSCLNMRSGSPT